MQLKRSELYSRVCNAPLSKLAPELGLTGTALAAVCRQYQIPYPGSGYWTRKSLGLSAELPALPDGSDEIIEIMPVTPKPRKQKAPEASTPPKTRSVARTRRLEHHPLLFGAEEHLRKSRAAKDGEFLRPYKRILPDVISSEAALLRALSIANDLYVALDRQGFRVHIAPAGEGHRRISVQEQEVPAGPKKSNEEYRRNQHGAALAGFREFSTRDRREQASRRSFSIAVVREAGPTGPVCHVTFCRVVC